MRCVLRVCGICVRVCVSLQLFVCACVGARVYVFSHLCTCRGAFVKNRVSDTRCPSCVLSARSLSLSLALSDPFCWTLLTGHLPLSLSLVFVVVGCSQGHMKDLGLDYLFEQSPSQAQAQAKPPATASSGVGAGAGLAGSKSSGKS